MDRVGVSQLAWKTRDCTDSMVGWRVCVWWGQHELPNGLMKQHKGSESHSKAVALLLLSYCGQAPQSLWARLLHCRGCKIRLSGLPDSVALPSLQSGSKLCPFRKQIPLKFLLLLDGDTEIEFLRTGQAPHTRLGCQVGLRIGSLRVTGGKETTVLPFKASEDRVHTPFQGALSPSYFYTCPSSSLCPTMAQTWLTPWNLSGFQSEDLWTCTMSLISAVQFGTCLAWCWCLCAIPIFWVAIQGRGCTLIFCTPCM